MMGDSPRARVRQVITITRLQDLLALIPQLQAPLKLVKSVLANEPIHLIELNDAVQGLHDQIQVEFAWQSWAAVVSYSGRAEEKWNAASEALLVQGELWHAVLTGDAPVPAGQGRARPANARRSPRVPAGPIAGSRGESGARRA